MNNSRRLIHFSRPVLIYLFFLYRSQFSITAYNLTMIIIEPYNPAWPKEFELLRQELAEVLGELVLRIDHIGSTSVPGMAAKDVIDVQVTVTGLSEEIVQRMITAGYVFAGHVSDDHLPAGEIEDSDHWQKYYFSEKQGERRAHIHVRVAGKANQRYPLLFRDYLRTHPNTAETIVRIKRELAARFTDDVDAYYAVKDPVYDLVYQAAQAWAEQTGWQLD